MLYAMGFRVLSLVTKILGVVSRLSQRARVCPDASRIRCGGSGVLLQVLDILLRAIAFAISLRALVRVLRWRWTRLSPFPMRGIAGIMVGIRSVVTTVDQVVWLA